jgi:hypothetical protein
VDRRATENTQTLTTGKQTARLMERNVQNANRKDIMLGPSIEDVRQDLQSLTVNTELDEEAAEYEEVAP